MNVSWFCIFPTLLAPSIMDCIGDLYSLPKGCGLEKNFSKISLDRFCLSKTFGILVERTCYHPEVLGWLSSYLSTQKMQRTEWNICFFEIHLKVKTFFKIKYLMFSYTLKSILGYFHRIKKSIYFLNILLWWS